VTETESEFAFSTQEIVYLCCHICGKGRCCRHPDAGTIRVSALEGIMAAVGEFCVDYKMLSHLLFHANLTAEQALLQFPSYK
jgi:hypothetical protein